MKKQIKEEVSEAITLFWNPKKIATPEDIEKFINKYREEGKKQAMEEIEKILLKTKNIEEIKSEIRKIKDL